MRWRDIVNWLERGLAAKVKNSEEKDHCEWVEVCGFRVPVREDFIKKLNDSAVKSVLLGFAELSHVSDRQSAFGPRQPRPPSSEDAKVAEATAAAAARGAEQIRPRMGMAGLANVVPRPGFPVPPIVGAVPAAAAAAAISPPARASHDERPPSLTNSRVDSRQAAEHTESATSDNHQSSLPPSESRAADPAAAAVPPTDGMPMTREEEAKALQKWWESMPDPEADTSDDIQPRKEAPVPAAAAASSHPPWHPPHPHPLPAPISDQPLQEELTNGLSRHGAEPAAAPPSSKSDRLSDQHEQMVGESAAVREAHENISRGPDAMTTDAAAAGSGQPFDAQSQPSQQTNVTPLPPSVSDKQLPRGPPVQIQKTSSRGHREVPPSGVWSGSCVDPAFSVTADDRLSDIQEDDGDVISVSYEVQKTPTRDHREVPPRIVWSRRKTYGDDGRVLRMIVGSGHSEAEFAALHSLVPSMADECEFTLLYRATRDGPSYGKFLGCVGDESELVFVLKKNAYVFGAYMSGAIPHHSDDETEAWFYSCDVWHFSLSGHFKQPTKMMEGRHSIKIIGRESTVWGGVKLWIGGLFGGGAGLGLGCEGGAAADMLSCCHFIPDGHACLPEGYVGVRDENGYAVFGGSKGFMADELEVIGVQYRSLLSLKMIQGATFDALTSAALYHFLGEASGRRLKLIYRATRDGPSYGKFLGCVGDESELVFVVKKNAYVFGAYVSGRIKPPDDPTGENIYDCDVWHFSLSGHFKQPTKMIGGRRVRVAGREGTVYGRAKLWIGARLWLGCGAAADMYSCRQFVGRYDVPEGYVGPRDMHGKAVFGGSKDFMADDLEVLCVEERSD
ncbi:unnamed protein product [Vitrella brassicaformis CCMP3155]|uniref:TLDc domain-containing protein n=1 Tax=Vitrella brassicaformis (strain CCMP3155) TaxID=1169540 RepID=A0A0G4G7K8_VITBC|nr:unnamed protein product [Vitrella brassicaformis CCMP3155]|eukprot:CEM24677.1 unnamed protein product [Vitrella brassicaformis CCMP3155]